jgi:tripartite-type tricarboxylate transporter receptor subunit TctC
MKALAVVGTVRSPLLPNVPTTSEAGYPEVNVVPWYGYGAPRGTPQPVIDKIVAGFNEVMKIPNIRAALQKQALQPMEPMSAGEIAELYAEPYHRHRWLLRARRDRPRGRCNTEKSDELTPPHKLLPEPRATPTIL